MPLVKTFFSAFLLPAFIAFLVFAFSSLSAFDELFSKFNELNS
jgi:hypothetical protein